jgi:homoserine dehydrogenase
MKKELTIGLIGFGCVGSGLYEVLNKSKMIDAQIKSIVVKDPTKKRSIPESFFSYSRDVVLNDPEINVVVELINDSQVAFDIVSRALSLGKHVVTANKKMIAEYLPQLLEVARRNNVSLLYEGAVAGSIPIIRNLEEYYNNDSLSTIEGIVNGTTNYILTKSNDGIDYDTALKQAKELGFAEEDPTLDVEGYDSKYKLSILIKHAFGATAPPKQLLNIGIQKIQPEDVQYALEKGLRIKLLSRAERLNDTVAGFVAPHFVDASHAGYEVNNEFNAVSVQGLFSDKQLFIGKGAGSHPTASAVLSDISALKFEYKYEYRKAKDNPELQLTNDFYIKIYTGARDGKILRNVPFAAVEERFESKDYAYRTGWVHYRELQEYLSASKHELSIIVLPEKLMQLSDTIFEASNKVNLLEIV